MRPIEARSRCCRATLLAATARLGVPRIKVADSFAKLRVLPTRLMVVRKIPFCPLNIRLQRGIKGILHSNSTFFSFSAVVEFPSSFKLTATIFLHPSFLFCMTTTPPPLLSRTPPSNSAKLSWKQHTIMFCFFQFSICFLLLSIACSVFLFQILQFSSVSIFSSYVPISSSFSIFPTVLFLFCFIFFFLPMFCFYFSSLSLFSPSTFSVPPCYDFLLLDMNISPVLSYLLSFTLNMCL